MRYLLTGAFAALMGLVAVQPAQAESPGGKDFYGSLSVGVVAFTKDTGIGDGPRSQSDVESDLGYNIEGAVGGFIGRNYRSDLAIGYRSYDAEGAFYNPSDGSVAAEGLSSLNAITAVWNNYFHVLEGDHQPYFGFGLGAAFWSFDGPAFASSYKTAFLGQAVLGYDFYLSGLPSQYMSMGGGLFEDMAVGVSYRFSWSNPKPSGVGGAKGIFNNDDLQQVNHNVMFTARYEF